MPRTLWWPSSGLFLAQEPPLRRDTRASRGASFFAGIVIALALTALL